jgi:hypothetical protein
MDGKSVSLSIYQCKSDVRWMNGHSIIKVLLCSWELMRTRRVSPTDFRRTTHFNSDAEPLDSLITALADHVQAHYFLVFTIDDKLIDGWFSMSLIHEIKVHGFELGVICSGVSEREMD